jgi:hypothetical protein
MHAAATLPLESTATIILSDLPGTKYRLQRQITVQMEQDECGAFVASEPTTGVFSYSPDWYIALDGFVRAFVDQFEFLAAKESNLSPALSAELEQFRHVITVRK